MRFMIQGTIWYGLQNIANGYCWEISVNLSSNVLKTLPSRMILRLGKNGVKSALDPCCLIGQDPREYREKMGSSLPLTHVV